jgi:cytochrome P450
MITLTPDLADFDLRHLPPAFYDNPYPWYAALHAQGPVRPMPDGSYLVSSYALCEQVYKDTERFSSDKHAEFGPKYGVGSPLYAHHTTSLVFNDPPLHTRVRRLIAGALSPKAIAELEGGLAQLVDRLLAAMAAKATAGNPVDLIEDFASAIPVEIIGNLLGVPHQEREPLRQWSLAVLGALEPQLTPQQAANGHQAVTEMLAYLAGLVARRRLKPGDPQHDVLTRLIQGEADGERLSEHELYQNCIFILNAGHETTTNLIGNGLVALLEWPEQKQKLLAEPDRIRLAIEEFLRFESSNQLGNRITTCEVALGPNTLPPRTPVTLCIGAANRDPAQYPNPDVLDITRSPNRHLAFASGPHQCVGMNLARLEGRIAISAFLARYPDYRLAGPIKRGGRARFRGYLNVPLKLE